MMGLNYAQGNTVAVYVLNLVAARGYRSKGEM